MKTSVTILAGGLLGLAGLLRPTLELSPATKSIVSIVTPPIEAPGTSDSPPTILRAEAGEPSPEAFQVERRAKETVTSGVTPVALYMARLLNAAYRAVRHGDEARAKDFCRRLLRVDPHYEVALQLQALVDAGATADPAATGRMIDSWEAETVESTSSPRIPVQSRLRFPCLDELFEIRMRDGSPYVERPTSEDQRSWTSVVYHRLNELKVDLKFVDARPDDILAAVRVAAGVVMSIEPGAQRRITAASPMATLRLSQVSVRDALRMLLQNIDERLGFVVSAQGLLVIGDAQELEAAGY